MIGYKSQAEDAASVHLWSPDSGNIDMNTKLNGQGCPRVAQLAENSYGALNSRLLKLWHLAAVLRSRYYIWNNNIETNRVQTSK
ncbi:hypothetical protein TNCT_135991 [Trichonephila clavata]|uniref:Uncharacterized protein n=1 Tax=Trichonephila clavata TaxID=2740835 RepID=A0A8X6HD77_TRICU|nr:hypothetical protein TNCT_135991 [Trichonephila clavata]